MNWNLNIQATVTNPANNLVAAIYDHSAPTIVVQSIVLPKPYGSSIQIVFANVQAILYDFVLYETPGTTAIGTIRSFFVLQPTEETTLVREDLYLVADTSVNFTSGANSYTADAPNDLTSWKYSLERVGAGTLQPGVDYASDTNGFHLLMVGDQFGPGEKFVLHFIPIVKQSPVTATNVNLISATRIITIDTALDFTDITKAILIQGAGDSLTVTMPLLSTVPDNKLIMFFSNGGNHISAGLQCDGTDVWQWVGGTPNKIILTQNEQLWAFKANGVWNVAFASDTIRMTGEIVYNYSKLSPNAVFANGDLLSRTAYARLWEYVQSLEAGVVISNSSWDDSQIINGRTVYVNNGKYSFGDGSTTFRLPKIYTVGNLKGVDGSGRLPGNYQADSVGPAQIKTKAFTGQGLGKNSFNSNTGVGHLATYGDGGFVTTDSASGTNNNDARTEPWDIISPTSETKEANFGIYALIRI